MQTFLRFIILLYFDIIWHNVIVDLDPVPQYLLTPGSHISGVNKYWGTGSKS